MFDVLETYRNSDHFFFTTKDNLSNVCNAPVDKAGVYLVYALRKGKIELVYIGRSGQLKADGTLFIRQGGIKDRLVNGKRDGVLRRTFWISEMIKEGIEALDIYWYVTHDNNNIDCPKKLEDFLLNAFKDLYGQCPKWNRT
jgi:hypothetical protein